METILEKQDALRGYYSADDLSHKDVVAQATADIRSQAKAPTATLPSSSGQTAQTAIIAAQKAAEHAQAALHLRHL
jgi:hypothetical protein